MNVIVNKKVKSAAAFNDVISAVEVCPRRPIKNNFLLPFLGYTLSTSFLHHVHASVDPKVVCW